MSGFALAEALSAAGVTAIPRRKRTLRSTRRGFLARRVQIWGVLDRLSAPQGTLARLLIGAGLLQYDIHIASVIGHMPGQPGRVMSYLERLETPYQSVQALPPRGALLSALARVNALIGRAHIFLLQTSSYQQSRGGGHARRRKAAFL